MINHQEHLISLLAGNYLLIGTELNSLYNNGGGFGAGLNGVSGRKQEKGYGYGCRKADFSLPENRTYGSVKGGGWGRGFALNNGDGYGCAIMGEPNGGGFGMNTNF